MWCMCAQIYMDQSKFFFDHFICIWKWFLSLFVLGFNALLCFSLFKHVLYWKTSVRVFRDSLVTHDSPITKPQSWVHPKAFATHLVTRENFRDSPSRETPRNSILKGFSWETCFKPLPSSLKFLFHYLYIKTQSIWMVFHSINTSKVILNSFLWFWSLDYVLESFCALGWDFHHGVEET